jgi:predicted  nucleic acid-binding Zn-ribbon protein
MERLQSEIDAENAEITNKRNVIKDAELLIKRYEEQQMNVRNNREYDALSKEIEFQKLEIELAEKRIREYSLNIEHKTEALNGVNEQLEERNKHLEHKNAELDKILKETEKEEAQLQKAADKVGAEIEDRLLNAYHRIRENAKNGLAVVTIERNAIGGSFFTIPPQQQMEIAQRKKIMTSEHCGRILVDPELASEEEERMNKEFGELA